MALSGTFKSSKDNGANINLDSSNPRWCSYIYVTWTAIQNKNNNTSTISWKCYGGSDYSNTTSYVACGPVVVKINGTTVLNITDRFNLSKDELIGSGSLTVSHNSDGTKSVSASISAAIYNFASNCTYSGTITLDTIPRASVMNSLSCNTSYFDGTLTYKYTPQSASYYNKCNISLNLDGTFKTVKTINIGKKSASQQTETATLSASELSTIYSKLPKTAKGILRFTLRTYSDSGYSTQVGDASYKEVTLNIPTSVIPKLGTITLDPANITTVDGTSRNLLVQGKNKISVSISGCSAGEGSSIKSYTFAAIYNSKVIETKTVTSSSTSASTSFGPFSQSGSILFRVTVTDNRSRSKNNSGNEPSQTCYVYSAPSFSSFTAYRCNSSGTADDSGANIKYSFGVKYSSVNSTNKYTVQIYYKKGTASSWTAAANALTNSTDTSAAAIIKNSNNTSIVFDESLTYIIYATITDNYNGSVKSSSITVFGASRIFNVRQNGSGIAFGKMAETNNLFESKWSAKFDDKLNVIGAVTIPDDGGPIINGYSVGTLGPGKNIESGDDLNDYINEGVFGSTSAEISETLGHTPHTTSGFKLVVEHLANTTYLRQVVIPRTSTCKYYIRYYASGTWYAWQSFSADDTTDYLPLSGGTLTGKLTLDGGLYYSNDTAGIDCKNSDIVNANAIYFQDASDSAGEAINFYHSNGYWDTLYAYGGALKFHPNRSTSTSLGGYTVYNSSNFRRGTCTLNSSSSTTITFSSALGGTPTVMLTPLTSSAGVIPGKVTSVSSTGFSAVIGGNAVSEAKFAYLAIYY